ncbi:NAD-dependent succinate-semialdehyde dehydrogenase [Nocardioides sp. DS6]|uniref:NAD-dependent succinate-semialdehyde dehydrogenase n=1 Tax=Nocardioides eburneus TaxID=3231482 RepID=A0ABV3T0B6_9ACTN
MEILADLHIGGTWVPGETGERFPVIDPSDSSVIAEFAVASRADALRAVDVAAAAFPAWRDTSPRDRAEVLRAAFELLREEREWMAELIIRENGKAYADAIGEADYAIEFFRWFSEEASRVGGDFRLAPRGDKRIVVSHEPIGVSLLVTPWNYPAAMATRKLAPALAAGCTTVLKPAMETPLTAAYVVDALQRAGVPDGVVNLVTPVETGPVVDAMLHHPAVRKLSFTGSTEVGRILLREAADQVISTSMELGGNAPFLVLPGADVDAAVEGAMVAKMRNGGSACTAANRFYVHSSLHEEFAAKLSEAMAAVSVGSGLDRSHGLGALVSLAERDKVASLVSTAVEEGATTRTGGKGSDMGAFYDPTVLVGVEHGSTITRHEIFGPVAALISYDDVDTAVEWANATEFGLIAYVYGEQSLALRVARRLESGMVGINRALLSDPAAPFGGVKQSGLGREGSSEGIHEFLETKYLGLDV